MRVYTARTIRIYPHAHTCIRPYAGLVQRAEMTSLSPPGTTNEGNICFASSILHCLLNQRVFFRVLDRVKLQHSPRCNECQQGLFNCHYIAIFYTEGTRVYTCRTAARSLLQQVHIHTNTRSLQTCNIAVL